MVELVAPLAARRHKVDVYVPSSRFGRQAFPGIRVATVGDFTGARYDVVIYNSGLGVPTLDRIRRMSARKLMCQHSYDVHDPGLRLADAVWYPSRVCMLADKATRYRKFVVNPPVDPDRYSVTPGEKVGLCLSSPWKGGLLVADIARALPQHEFLVVKDPRGHGVDRFKGLGNVELADFLQPKEFYGRTRVQLLPSKSESYGRVGVEGAISGIPLIASTDPGIREAMQGYGTFIPRNEPAKWIAAVDRLMSDPAAWQRASLTMKARAAINDYTADQAAFCAQVERLAAR